MKLHATFSVKLPKVPDSILEHFGKRYGIGNDEQLSNILGNFSINVTTYRDIYIYLCLKSRAAGGKKKKRGFSNF